MFHGSELTTAFKINKYASILTLIQTVMIFNILKGVINKV